MGLVVVGVSYCAWCRGENGFSSVVPQLVRRGTGSVTMMAFLSKQRIPVLSIFDSASSFGIEPSNGHVHKCISC